MASSPDNMAEPSAPATASASAAPNRSLLREWSYAPVATGVVLGEEEVSTGMGGSSADLPSAAAEMDSTVPQSPAGRFAAAAYNLPVATYVRDNFVRDVRDFVRTSMEQLESATSGVAGASATSSQQPPQEQEPQPPRSVHSEPRQQAASATTAATSSSQDGNNPFPLSVRSEADAEGLAAMVSDSQQQHQQHEQQQHHTVSARTVDDYMNEEAEFILVDGDLIALPPSASQDTDYDLDSHALSHQPKACRPSRMRRGVRKIGKWLNRGKNKKNPRASSIESSIAASQNSGPVSDLPTSIVAPNQSTTTNDTALTEDGVNSSISNNTRGFARQTSLGESSTHSSPGRRSQAKNNKKNEKNKHQPRQTRRSWRQRDEWRQRLGSEDQQTARDMYSDDGDVGADVAAAAASASASAAPPTLRLEQAETGLLTAAQLQSQRERLPMVEPPQPPAMQPIQEASTGSGRTVTATPIGTTDQLSQAQQDGDLPPPAHAFVEYEVLDEKEKKDEIPASLVPKDGDYKVDKADAPDVESMLLRAAHENICNLDPLLDLDRPMPRPKGKSDGSSVPLTQAKSSDALVHNDMLKVLLVGSVGTEKSALARAIRESPKKPRKRTTLGLDAHTWSCAGVNFQIWDVQGSTAAAATCSNNNESVPNFGAHPGTQSLFFSSDSLYLLVWDLAYKNPHVHPVFDFDESDEEEDNQFAREQAIAEADRALQEDIASRVLAWVDRIGTRAPGSAVLPVAILPDGMDQKEIKRRCTKMFEALEQHVKWKQDTEDLPNIVLDDSRNVLCVNYAQNHGIKQLQETMVAIAESEVFEHVGTAVPPGTVQVLEYARSVKREHKLIRLDHILGILEDSVPVKQVIRALHFLASVGEIMYYGPPEPQQDDVLSGFVVLSRQWLVSALSCILRNDLKRELADARKFMNLQCLYSDEKFEENEVTKALGSGAPVLTNEDASLLWRSMSFMREAADSYAQLNESSTSAPTLFYFLERLLVHHGVFIPFGKLHQEAAGLEQPSEVFFVPSLLSQADPGDVWGYRNTVSWTTTLCHSWLFRSGAPPDFFEQVAVGLLRDLYLFSREFTGVSKDQLARTRSTPLGRASKHDFVTEHGGHAIGPVRIHQIICWKSAILLKIGTIFPDKETDELRESTVEVFVTMVDQNSNHCVASDAMRGSMQRIVVSGRGQSGLNGLKLFKGGYQCVLDSVQSSLANKNNINKQAVCPDCLAHGSPRRASTWPFEDVESAASERRESTIVCRRGHRVKSNLLVGSCVGEEPISPRDDIAPSRPVTDILPSIVLIGLWDPRTNQIRSVGSGFFCDKKYGLVATAGHVLFDMEEGANYGTPYLGIQDAKVVIGVLADSKAKNAVWRYFAQILADDVRSNVDACILRITSKMENDVDKESPGCSEPEIVLDPTMMREENLSKLKLETNFDLDESVRILGYSQEKRREGEIVRSPDFAKGYICKLFSANVSDDSSSDESDSESRQTFSPREEIIVLCPTISGHSGGPGVNDDGLVVGILSRADPTDGRRCFLVPAGQLKSLLRRARGLCSRPVYPQTTTTDLSRFNTL